MPFPVSSGWRCSINVIRLGLFLKLPRTSESVLTIADLRSVTGLIIGLYVTMHLSNHALGLISVRAQEAVRPWVMTLWHSPPGQVLLYGSLSIHAAIALLILFRRRHYYMPA